MILETQALRDADGKPPVTVGPDGNRLATPFGAGEGPVGDFIAAPGTEIILYAPLYTPDSGFPQPDDVPDGVAYWNPRATLAGTLDTVNHNYGWMAPTGPGGVVLELIPLGDDRAWTCTERRVSDHPDEQLIGLVYRRTAVLGKLGLLDHNAVDQLR